MLQVSKKSAYMARNENLYGACRREKQAKIKVFTLHSSMFVFSFSFDYTGQTCCTSRVGCSVVDRKKVENKFVLLYVWTLFLVE